DLGDVGPEILDRQRRRILFIVTESAVLSHDLMVRRNQPGEDGVPAPGPETVLEDRPSPHPGELCLHNRAISATMVEERISCRIRKHPNDIDTGSEAPTGQHRAHRAAARRPPL